ncbi:hypothetical protein [Marinobacter alexandrii]|uniref:hypothetical protein n=1 Tax=Marinobacter alexandrii TaxID=2570351 RepID=UPI00329724DC
MNIRYTLLAFLLGSQLSVAEQPDTTNSNLPAAQMTAAQSGESTAAMSAMDISAALTEKLDRRLAESTAKQQIPNTEWASANLSPGS